VASTLITSTDADGIAIEVARLVRENYVFPAQAEQLAELLAEQVAVGAYSSLPDVVALAAALTADLQSANGDRHLRVLYTDEPVVDLEDEEAELAMLAARSKRESGGIARADILPGNIGILEIRPVLYPPILVEDRITAAMTSIADADALILDVRGCVGGSPDTVALVCSYLFDEQPVHLNSMVDRSGEESEQSWTLARVPGARFGPSKPVVVLTSKTTFSGGEELAYDLQQLGRATVIGEQTGGGAHPRIGFRVHGNLEATIPVARAVNPVSGTNWELVGVTPDIETSVADAFGRAVELLTN
jgi:C-terminal processing protease CtpA/Prc